MRSCLVGEIDSVLRQRGCRGGFLLERIRALAHARREFPNSFSSILIESVTDVAPGGT
jgi:hypothetical protein